MSKVITEEQSGQQGHSVDSVGLAMYDTMLDALSASVFHAYVCVCRSRICTVFRAAGLLLAHSITLSFTLSVFLFTPGCTL